MAESLIVLTYENNVKLHFYVPVCFGGRYTYIHTYICIYILCYFLFTFFWRSFLPAQSLHQFIALACQAADLLWSTLVKCWSGEMRTQRSAQWPVMQARVWEKAEEEESLTLVWTVGLLWRCSPGPVTQMLASPGVNCEVWRNSQVPRARSLQFPQSRTSESDALFKIHTKHDSFRRKDLTR